MRSSILALAAAAAVASASTVDASASYDYLMLVEQYAITICSDGTYSCNADWTFFTMHGLWPERNDGSYPSTCTNEKFDMSKVKAIESDLNTYWPSLNGPAETFWAHEYEKHGTCAEDVFPNELAFMNGTLALRAKYDAIPALAAAGIQPSNKKGFSLKTFRTALAQAYGNYPVVSCDSKGNINGLTFCISKSQEIMACPSATKDDCSASTLYLPATPFTQEQEEEEEEEQQPMHLNLKGLRGANKA